MQKKISVTLLFPAALFLMTGCAFESAPYVDREFGKASQFSLDQQILYPDYRYADRIPAGTPGIIAEEIMGVHIDTYKEKPTNVEVFQFEVTK